MAETERGDPRVSVICIFFNSEAYLREAIDSVLEQDFADYELILVDDGSTDASGAIAAEYLAAHPDRIRILNHPGKVNRGISPSHNLALANVRGEFVAWVDSDDRWRPGKLRQQVAILTEHGECAMVCGRVNYWHSWEGGDPEFQDEVILTGGLADAGLPAPEALARLYPVGDAAAAGPSEVMVRRSAVMAVGGFEDRFTRMYADQALFTKIYLYYPVWFASQIWVDYRQHSESSCSRVRSERGDLIHRRGFFEWLAGWLKSQDGACPPRIMREVRRECLWLRVPLLWKARHRLMLLTKRLGAGGGGQAADAPVHAS